MCPSMVGIPVCGLSGKGYVQYETGFVKDKSMYCLQLVMHLSVWCVPVWLLYSLG